MSKHTDCARIQEMLPWYLNDTAAAAQRLEVQTHLQHCDDCAAEAEWLLTVQNEMPVIATGKDGNHPAVDHVFGQLMERIEQQRHKRDRRQLLLAASVLLAVATLLGSLFTSYLVEPRFRTVTDTVMPAHAVMQIEVRFAPEAQLASLRSVMDKTAAEVRKGPDAEGWVLLEVPLNEEQTAGEILAAMRADVQVLEARLSPAGTSQDDGAEQ